MILTSKEQIEEYTSKGYWGNTTLNHIFKSFVDKQPKKDCFVDQPTKQALVGLGPERISYGDADKIIDILATNLLGLGIGKDDVVVVQLPNIVELAISYLALWRIGAIASPTAMQWRSHELNYVAKITEAKAFITLEEFQGFDHLRAAQEIAANQTKLEHVISLSRFKEMCDGEIDKKRLNEISNDANDITTICWTSGTEAEPKACPMSHNNWIYQGTNLNRACMLQQGDIILNPAPIVNMSGIGVGYMLSVLNGGTLVMHHPFEPLVYLKQLIDEKVSFSGAVPAMLVMILKNPEADKYDISCIRSFGTGSAPPAAWVLDEFKKRWDIEIVNIWGQNEGTGIISGPLDVDDPDKRVDNFPNWGAKGVEWGSVGISGMESKIIGSDLNKPLEKVGEVGELLMKGPNVFPGYYNQPSHTEHAFDSEGFFKTGDLFKIGEDNFLMFFDRKKDIIIRGGQNISAAEVENIVKGHPKVADAAAVEMADERLGEKVCMFVVPLPDQQVTLEDVTSFMKKEGIAIYKFPERLETIDVIPRNPLGKVIKAPLRDEIKQKLAGD